MNKAVLPAVFSLTSFTAAVEAGEWKVLPVLEQDYQAKPSQLLR